jgi:SanA protein
MKKLKIKKKLLIIFTIIIVIILSMIIICNYIVEKSSKEFVYSDINNIQPKKAGLLLGTSKYLGDGRKNQYFINRINAAVELYHAGKIKFIVISGDNHIKEYNEPLDMKKELIKKGIPKNAVYLDYAGFRTFDSVIRMYKIFGQREFIVISQAFHNKRAVYIANQKGLRVIGYNARDIDAYYGFKTNMRELIARVKLIMDLAYDKQPKFLGDKIELK